MFSRLSHLTRATQSAAGHLLPQIALRTLSRGLAINPVITTPYKPPAPFEDHYTYIEDVHAPRRDIWRVHLKTDPGQIFRAKDARTYDSEYDRLMTEKGISPEELDLSRHAPLFLGQREAFVNNVHLWLSPNTARPGPTSLVYTIDEYGNPRYMVMQPEIPVYIGLDALSKKPNAAGTYGFYCNAEGNASIDVPDPESPGNTKAVTVIGRIECKVADRALWDEDPNPTNIGLAPTDNPDIYKALKIDNEYCLQGVDPSVPQNLFYKSMAVAAGMARAIHEGLNLDYLPFKNREEKRRDVVSRFADKFRNDSDHIRSLLQEHFPTDLPPDQKSALHGIVTQLTVSANTLHLADILLKTRWNRDLPDAEHAAAAILNGIPLLPGTPAQQKDIHRQIVSETLEGKGKTDSPPPNSFTAMLQAHRRAEKEKAAGNWRR